MDAVPDCCGVWLLGRLRDLLLRIQLYHVLIVGLSSQMLVELFILVHQLLIICVIEQARSVGCVRSSYR